MSGIIKDPWKIVTPLKEDKKTEQVQSKKDLNQIDDTATNKYFYDIRGNNGSIRVECKSGDIALKKVVLFLRFVRHEIGDDRLITDGIGFKVDDDVFNTHELDKSTSTMSAGDVSIYFVEQTHDEGLSRLVALLIDVNKTHKDTYKKFGIEPIQR